MRLKLSIFIACLLSLTLMTGFTRAQSVDELKTQRQQIQERIDELNSLVEQKKQEAVNLSTQIAIFDAKIEQLELQIQETQLKINDKQTRIDELTGEIGRQQRRLDYHKQILDDSLQILYERGDQNLVMVLLSAKGFSDFVEQVTYIDAVKEQVKNTIVQINILKSSLESQRGELRTEKRSLEDLKREKDQEQEALENQRQAKAILLEQTQGDEVLFQEQLEKANAEEQNITTEIDRQIEEAKRKLLERYPQLDSGEGFGYPLSGLNRISVIGGDYLDPYYGFGFPHTAVDLAAGQGTPVYSAADGVVVVAYDSGGTGLSYIAIQHTNGFLTKYLHMSEVFVSSGQYISRGEAIGLSGGSPGTRGAGYYTTGPHLHFEINDANGNSVNPHNFLDIAGP